MAPRRLRKSSWDVLPRLLRVHADNRRTHRLVADHRGPRRLAAIYPLFDIALLLILLNLAFTTSAVLTSFRLLLGMMCLLFVGDVGYAIIGVQGKLFASPAMDVPFLIGFVCIGAAALHPSVVELGRGVPLQVQPWSWQRLLLIGPALAVPLVLIPLVAQESMLHRHAVPAHAVVLEITESVMIEPWTLIDQVLLDLRAPGLRIVVDDFGTGYSALGYLRRHPVTGVKIDRAFIGGLGTSAEDEEIVRAVVAMSGAMGLTTVAEGVETPTQQDVLVGLGVLFGQGHLWSAPLSPAEFGVRWSTSVSSVGGS